MLSRMPFAKANKSTTKHNGLTTWIHVWHDDVVVAVAAAGAGIRRSLP